MASYHLQAQSAFLHRNVYLFTDRYPYPPVWVWLVALAQGLATLTTVPFVTVVKLPGILGDGLIVALLRQRLGTRAALFYALNPVALLISAGHGQFDGLVLASVVAAWVFWKAQRVTWAALALGIGIALKVYPVLLLPALVVSLPTGPRQLRLVLVAVLPVLLSMLLYTAIFGFTPAMLTHVLGYGGTQQFGWSAYLFGLSRLAEPLLPVFLLALLVTGLLLAGRVAVLCLPLLVLRLRPRRALELLWLVTFLGFMVVSPGISAQYLLWVVPLFALAEQVRWGWLYSVGAGLVLVCFYGTTHPGAIPGGAALHALPAVILQNSYLVANLAWWLLCLWLWRQTLKYDHGRVTPETRRQDVVAGVVS